MALHFLDYRALSEYAEILCVDIVTHVVLIYMPHVWEDKFWRARETVLYLNSFGLCGRVNTGKNC